MTARVRIQRVKLQRDQPTVAIDDALRDPRLLGASLGHDYESWQAWFTVLRAAFGLPLSRQERARFRQVAGDRQPPQERVDELWAIVGRRGGKSRVAAAIGVHAACFLPHHLVPGEVGEVAIVAASKSQSVIIFKYLLAFIEASPVLRQEIESTTTNEIRMRQNIVIAVRAGSYRTVRGRTLLAAIVDEVAFLRDETSAIPDIELYRALLPSLATTHGMLIGISTPYRRVGLLHQKHRDYFGQDDPHVLVVAGPSRIFNPTIDQSLIDRATASDPEAARAEWEGEFRDDLSGFLDDAIVEQAIEYSRPLELPPRPNLTFKAFVDASGGRHDHYTIAIGHADGERLVCDVIRGAAPPFDPQQITQEFAALAKDYGVSMLRGDNYSAGWVETAWRDNGLTYERSDLNKSALYIEALPSFTRGLVSIPNHSRLVRELRLLERHTSRIGKDVVDHGRNGSDDFANSLCGLLQSLTVKSKYPRYDSSLKWVDDDDETVNEDYRRARLQRFINSHGMFR